MKAMKWEEVRNERDVNGELTLTAQAVRSLEVNGCDCPEDEPDTCLSCRCEAALKAEWLRASMAEVVEAELVIARDALRDAAFEADARVRAVKEDTIAKYEVSERAAKREAVRLQGLLRERTLALRTMEKEVDLLYEVGSVVVVRRMRQRAARVVSLVETLLEEARVGLWEDRRGLAVTPDTVPEPKRKADHD